MHIRLYSFKLSQNECSNCSHLGGIFVKIYCKKALAAVYFNLLFSFLFFLFILNGAGFKIRFIRRVESRSGSIVPLKPVTTKLFFSILIYITYIKVRILREKLMAVISSGRIQIQNSWKSNPVTVFFLIVDQDPINLNWIRNLDF